MTTIEGGFLILSSLGRHAEAKSDYDTAIHWYERARGELFSRDLHLSRATIWMRQQRLADAQRSLDDYFRVNRSDARGWRLQGDLDMARGDAPSAVRSYEQAFLLGRWNDLGILRRFLDAAMQANARDRAEQMLPQAEQLFFAFADAVMRDTHFIDLSTNVAELPRVAAELSVLDPSHASLYRSKADEAALHAKEEQKHVTARRPGILW